MEVLKKNNRRYDRKGGKESAPWIGPYTIHKITHTTVFLTNNGKALKTGINISQVKRFYE